MTYKKPRGSHPVKWDGRTANCSSCVLGRSNNNNILCYKTGEAPCIKEDGSRVCFVKNTNDSHAGAILKLNTELMSRLIKLDNDYQRWLQEAVKELGMRYDGEKTMIQDKYYRALNDIQIQFDKRKRYG